MNILKKRKGILSDVLFILLIFAMSLFFFRGALIQGHAVGGRLDARLNNLIMEHWYKVFCGQETYNNLSMFYPAENTISYTDMLLASSIPYSILRACGVDMFVSCNIVIMAVHLWGSICLYYLLRKTLGVQNYISFAGVTAFSFAQGYATRIAHTQMVALSYIPFILIFLILFIRHFKETKKRRIYLFIFFTAYVLLAYTGWYSFYFSVVFGIVYIVSFLIFGFRCNREFIIRIFSLIKKHLLELFFWMVYTIVIMIPFLNVYLPANALKTYEDRSWNTVVWLSPEPIDLFNVGKNNLILGKVIEALNIGAHRKKAEWEMCEGFSVVLLIALLYLIGRYMKTHKLLRDDKKAVVPARHILIGSLIISIVTCILLIQNSGGVSLWLFAYFFLPGASSVRAVVRFYFILLLPMGILLALLLEQYKPKKYPVIKIMIYIIILWISNISIGNIGSWDYRIDQKLISGVSAPPEQAEVIAFFDSGSDIQGEQITQIDAWMIADYYGLKTVNGYSGMFPRDWAMEKLPTEDYLRALQQWKISQEIQDIYLYDLETDTWSVF